MLHVPDALSKRRLASWVVGVALVLLAGIAIVVEIREHRAARQLSAEDERLLGEASQGIRDWCLARRRPAGGQQKITDAIALIVSFAERDPRRKTSVQDSAYVTVRQVATNLARSMNGTCRRRVPDGDRLRLVALQLAADREGPSRAALTPNEVRAKLAAVVDRADIAATAGPPGVTTLMGNVWRRGDPPLRLAIVLGNDAARKTRGYRRPLVPGIDNTTAEHPVDGIDTALVLDTSGLKGDPYTVNTGIPRYRRTPAQRRGDLRIAVEEALVGQVPH